MAETRDIATRSEDVPATPTELEQQLQLARVEAREFPRDLQKVKTEIRGHIADPEIAETMWYALERWDKEKQENVSIVGPSVRLAEILAASWGNLHVYTRVTDVTQDTVTAAYLVVDLEKNTTFGGEETVRVYGRAKDRFKLARASAQAYARRNGIFRAIPGAYQKMALDHAHKVYLGQGVEQQREKMVAFFARNGVSLAEVLRVVNRSSLDDVTGDDVIALRGMANKIIEENKPVGSAVRESVDERAHAQAESSMEDSAAEQPTLVDALDAEQNALIISAKKKWGDKFDRVWKAATAVAGTDYDILRAILSASKTTVGAALLDDDPEAALLAVAKSAIKASRAAGAKAGT